MTTPTSSGTGTPTTQATRSMTATLSPDEQRYLAAWFHDALDRFPYYTYLASSMRVVKAPGLGTWAVDSGLRLYIDFEAVIPRGQTYNSESVLHELGHVFGRHETVATEVGARSAGERKVLNVAADMSINDDLVAAGCTSFITFGDPLPSMIGEPEGQSPHHYYRRLRQMQQDAGQAEDEQDPQRPDGGPSGQPGSGESDQPDPLGQPGQPSPGFGEPGAPSGAGSSNEPGVGEPGDGSGVTEPGEPEGPFKGCGSASGGPAAPCELGTDTLGGTAPPASPMEVELAVLNTALAVIDYASKHPGKVPGGLLDYSETLLEPSRTPWNRIFGSRFKTQVRRRRGQRREDYSTRSRRLRNVSMRRADGSRSGKVFFPGSYRPSIKVAYIRDTSGSIGDVSLAVFDREVEALSRSVGVRGRDLLVTDVDTVTHTPVPYRDRSSVREVRGRGGTDMRVGIAEACARTGQDRPAVVVVATDGLTPWPDEPPEVPVLALVVCPEADLDKVVADVPDFIEAVIVDDPVLVADVEEVRAKQSRQDRQNGQAGRLGSSAAPVPDTATP